MQTLDREEGVVLQQRLKRYKNWNRWMMYIGLFLFYVGLANIFYVRISKVGLKDSEVLNAVLALVFLPVLAYAVLAAPAALLALIKQFSIPYRLRFMRWWAWFGIMIGGLLFANVLLTILFWSVPSI